jgi:hypothetical protein
MWDVSRDMVGLELAERRESLCTFTCLNVADRNSIEKLTIAVNTLEQAMDKWLDDGPRYPGWTIEPRPIKEVTSTEPDGTEGMRHRSPRGREESEDEARTSHIRRSGSWATLALPELASPMMSRPRRAAAPRPFATSAPPSRIGADGDGGGVLGNIWQGRDHVDAA